MKAHIRTYQMCFLTGILGVGLLSFGAGPYGSGADTVTRSDPAVARLPGDAPVSSGEIRAEEGGVWEAYAGMVAAATTFPCCVDGTCAEMLPGDCASAPGTVVCACLGDFNPENGVDDACEPCAEASTALAEPMPCLDNEDCDEGTGSCRVDGICECSDNDDCWNRASCINGVCYVPKNRYISFDPNNAGRCVALRVDMTSCVTFPGCTFTKKWVGEPNPVTGISRVVDTPIYRDWTEEVIYVGDLEIVPASTYEVRAIQQDCDPDDPTKYSAPLVLPTVPKPTICEDSCVAPCLWADMVGIQVPPGVYLPPDGKVDFDDIVAMIEAILEDPNAPPITWTDLMREVPNGRIDIRDLIAVDDACRSDDPYFAGYPGASPCGTASVDQPSEGAEGPRTIDPDVDCRLFDAEAEYLLIKDTRNRYQTIPSQSVDVDLFIENVDELRAYQVKIVATRALGGVESLIPCEGGVQINVSHQVCAGTRENCLYEDDCKWWCVGVGNEGGACDPDADCDGGTCIAGSCVGGNNPGAQCDPDVDCPDGEVCEDAPKICVGGDNHRLPCVNDLECPGAGALCKACAYDFAFSMAPGGHTSYIRCSRLELGAASDPVDLQDRPPGYLGTYLLEIPDYAGCSTFEIYIVPEDEAQEETTFFLTPAQTANDDSIPYFNYDPCATFKVLFDCNKNDIPDECDIGDEEMCATALCQAYAGPGECGQSNNCNNNEYPDECEILEDTEYHPGEFFCSDTCVGCTADCICSATGEPCPEGCNYVTGEGCPEDCQPECVPVTAVCDPDCQPDDKPGHGIPDACDIANCAGDPDFCDCNKNDVPDKCDILGGTSGDNGFCDSQERDCSWDCQHDYPGEPGHRVPDECEANCNRWDGVDGDWCPDDCEDPVRADQGCGQGVAEQDCDGDGTCNAVEIVNCEPTDYACRDCNTNGIPDACDIAVSDGGLCDEPPCSSDCQPNQIPDECDITCADDLECTDDCMGNLCCKDCDNDLIPDGCNIRDCDGDVACEDCNFNSVPDACGIPVNQGGLCNKADPADCKSCDSNANGMPDECECTGASPTGACDNAFEDGPAESTFTIQAALAIQLVDENDEDFVGLASPFTGLSGLATISRGTLHFHDDDPEDKGNDQPCLVPPGFPEPHPTDFTRSREVHLEMTKLTLTGADVSLGLRSSALGEAQGTCLDFPADTFFAWYVQATIGTVELHSQTPIVLRAELSNFDWDYWWEYTSSTTAQRRSVFVNDHSAPAIPLFDTNGVHRAYLNRIQLGQGTFPSYSEDCAVDRAISGPVSFAVAGGTTGVFISPPNEVYTDGEEVAKKVRVYVSSGATSQAAPDTTNVKDTVLAGNTILEDDFKSDDRIKSLSFGQDGTRDPTAEGLSPILYFSVDGPSKGGDCTDVRSEWNRQGTAAADVFASPMPTFGNYAESPGALPSSCDTTRGNCLVADNTALGLGPHAGECVADNVIGLELDDFDIGDRAYLTFLGASFGGDSATIWVYDNHGDHDTYPFEPDNLLSYAHTSDLGLQAEEDKIDKIDALVVSDVTPGTKVCAGDQSSCASDGDCVGHGEPEICTSVPDGVWNTGDEVLFSLASGSQTLVDHGWSGAHIFKVTYGQIGQITAGNVFLGPAALGLMGGTDDIDAIDVGVSKVFDDCNHNGIDDLCDIARGFSANDIGPLDDVPDECETACTVESLAPGAEDTGWGICVEDRNCPNMPCVGGVCYTTKNRYLSFNPTDTGQRQAIRVTFEDLPAPFDVFNGQVMWVGSPKEYSDNSGKLWPYQAPDYPTFMGAPLQCEPYFTDWHGVCRCRLAETTSGWCLGGFSDGQTCSEDSDCAHTIHVYHEVIVPGGQYRVQTIDRRCTDLSNQLSYSDPLPVPTGKWGDICGRREPGGEWWYPPDGIVEVAKDVSAALDKFRNLDGTPIKARVDIEPHIPDQLVNISDVTYVLDAFRGFAYPAAQTPPAPGWPVPDGCP